MIVLKTQMDYHLIAVYAVGRLLWIGEQEILKKEGHTLLWQTLLGIKR